MKSFFVAEEYAFHTLCLKRKTPDQRMLFNSQISSYQSEMLQNKAQEDEDKFFHSKGIPDDLNIVLPTKTEFHFWLLDELFGELMQYSRRDISLKCVL